MARIMNDRLINEARMMRERGGSWAYIGRVLGVSEMTVITSVDPIAAEKRRRYHNEWRAKHGINSRGRVTNIRRENIEPRPDPELWQYAPNDTRSLTAYICGDPLPGRSALDRRQA